jgi:hypothetical protein
MSVISRRESSRLRTSCLRAVINGVARDDETERWDVKACGVIGICVPDIQRNDRIPFKAKRASVERLGSDKTIWNLPWESSPPTLNGIGCKCSLHALHHLRQCNRPSPRKTISQ